MQSCRAWPACRLAVPSAAMLHCLAAVLIHTQCLPSHISPTADWVCPCCRDLCNCSTHRKKKKWEATGQLHRSVKARGEALHITCNFVRALQ